MTDRQELINWLDLFSVSGGEEYTLSSGEKSNVYIDVKKTAQNGRVQKLLAKLLWEKILQEFKIGPETIAGVALGGCHLASITAFHAPIDVDVVHVRSAPKDHGTKQLLEGPTNIKDQTAVLIEDVVTTGNSSIKAAQTLEESGFHLLGIISVVDRRKEKLPYLKKGFIGWQFASLVNFEELTV